MEVSAQQQQMSVSGSADNPDPPPVHSKEAGPAGGQSDILLAGLWFGIVCGLLEGIVQLSAQQWLGSKYVSVDILWVAPCLYSVVFGLAGAGAGYLGLRLLPRFVTPVILLVFVFLTLLVPLMVLLQDQAADFAIVVLALGMSIVILRWLLERRDAVLAFIRRTVFRLAAAMLAAAVIIPAAMYARESAALAALPEHRAGAPNIVLVVIDTLRADHVSGLGYGRSTTPYLDELARRGVSYEHAYATSSWSLPSHVSLLTGNNFEKNGIGWYNQHGMRSYPGRVLPEILRDHGYRTGAFSANIFLVTHDRLGRGFIHFDDFFYNPQDAVLRTMYGRVFEKFVMQKLGFEDIPARRHAGDINRAFLSWLDSAPAPPFFALLNYMDVHDPYLPPEPYRTRFSPAARNSGLINARVERGYPVLSDAQLAAEVAAYDGGIAYVDEQIRRLVLELERRGMLANTIIAVTSDHGESFGEHGLLLHGSSLYHEQLHVPLILFWDGHIPEGVRPAYTVSNASLTATLLELCQLDNPMLDSEPSLAQWQSAAGPGSIATADVEQTDWVQEGSPAFTGMLRSIVQDEWQLIHHEHDGPQLFNLRDDPAELENLSGLERTREIESELGGLLGPDPGRFRGL